MRKLKLNNRLIGGIGELMFEHYCFQNGFAFIRLEDIYNHFTGRRLLKFKCNYTRIEVIVPEDIEEELRKVSKPTNGKENSPTFVYDYLTVNLRYSFDNINGNYVAKPRLCKEDFFWGEVKTGSSPPSYNQIAFARSSELPVKLFRIKFSEYINAPEITHGLLLDEVKDTIHLQEPQIDYEAEEANFINQIDAVEIIIEDINGNGYTYD